MWFREPAVRHTGGIACVALMLTVAGAFGSPEETAPAKEGEPQQGQALLAGSPPTLADLLEQYSHPRVAEQSVAIQDLRLTYGHLALTLTSGRAAPVFARTEAIGIFFAGDGSFDYVSVDPIESPVMAYDLAKGSKLDSAKTDKGLAVRGRFKTLFLWTAGRAAPALAGEPAPPLLEAFTDHREVFLQERDTPPAHLFVTQALDALDRPLIRAEMGCGSENLVYLYDGVDSQSESLTGLFRRSNPDPVVKSHLYGWTISDQPIEHDRRDTLTPRFSLTDLDYTLTATSGKEAALSVAETLVAGRQGMRTFEFDLHNTVYAVTANGRLEPHAFHLKSVVDGSGRALAFHHDRGNLLVSLREPVPTGTSVKMRFEIDGDFLIRPGGDNYWSLGIEPWFPQPPMSGQGYTVHSLVKVPEPFVPFASGTTVERKKEGSLNILESRIEHPVMFTVVLAGRYQFQEETRNGITVRVASYAGKNERAMKTLTSLAFGIIEYYQWFLGPFPMNELNILEINDYGFGQAPPGVMFITKEAFNPMLGEVSQFFSQGINERFAHEIAHQYWGIAVRMPSAEEQWLTESFAEYSAALFLKKMKGQATYDALVRHWKGNAKDAQKISPISLANRIRDPNGAAFIARAHLIYDKGAYLLAAIHKDVGDKTFLTFMKSYQKSFRWQFGTTKEAAGLLQLLTKKDYGPFFETNYWGTGMPD